MTHKIEENCEVYDLWSPNIILFQIAIPNLKVEIALMVIYSCIEMFPK